MKKNDLVLREYSKRLSDEDLRYLNGRFLQNLQDDRAEIFNKLSADKDVDQWLKGALSGDELFNMVDKVGEFVMREAKRRTNVIASDKDEA
jgi:hypothetical protein